jgi:hypothetical protein
MLAMLTLPSPGNAAKKFFDYKIDSSLLKYFTYPGFDKIVFKYEKKDVGSDSHFSLIAYAYVNDSATRVVLEKNDTTPQNFPSDHPDYRDISFTVTSTQLRDAHINPERVYLMSPARKRKGGERCVSYYFEEETFNAVSSFTSFYINPSPPYGQSFLLENSGNFFFDTLKLTRQQYNSLVKVQPIPAQLVFLYYFPSTAEPGSPVLIAYGGKRNPALTAGSSRFYNETMSRIHASNIRLVGEAHTFGNMQVSIKDINKLIAEATNGTMNYEYLVFSPAQENSTIYYTISVYPSMHNLVSPGGIRVNPSPPY